MLLEKGAQAPDFELPDQDGEVRRLSDYCGRKVVLYFYPRDSTPGCTTQARGFAERYPQIQERGAVVLGVSKDSVASHKRFAQKNELPFTLLSDPGLDVIKAYGAWGEKKMYGKTTQGVIRTTYLIDEQGVVADARAKVRAAADPQDMLELLGGGDEPRA